MRSPDPSVNAARGDATCSGAELIIADLVIDCHDLRFWARIRSANPAQVLELVDKLDLDSSAARRAGSSPALGTKAHFAGLSKCKKLGSFPTPAPCLTHSGCVSGLDLTSAGYT